MTATNYFRTNRPGYPTQASDLFPFAQHDRESTQTAWDAAITHASGLPVRVVVWSKPLLHGPWSDVRLVGESPPGAEVIGRPWIRRAPDETVN